MKKILLTFLSLTLTLGILSNAQSQTRQITGTVISAADGMPIPGVSVINRQNNTGAVTDLDGKYSISNVTSETTLTFSFIGYITREIVVGNQTTLNVELAENVSDLAEVVVTSFGMEKDRKALGYSVTQISGDRFTESRAVNLGNALSGKIAGVNVTMPSTGAAGSSRVVIRGGASLTGNDQPLYVVNGIPINTGNLGSAGMWGGNDGGDGLSSINPDDIESISVLKGNSAAALYGARAANGVIMITTKSGVARKGIGVSVNSNITFDKAMDFTDFQTVYGPGRDGVRGNTVQEILEIGTGHWGQPYDGQNSVQFDGQSRPYTHLGEGLSDFYNTAYTLNNSVALSGGNESGTYRFSFSDLDNKDIMPNAGFKRRVANINVNSKLKNLTLSLSGQYSKQEAQNRPRLSDSPGNANYSVITKPGNLPFDVLKGTTDKYGAREDQSELQYTQSTFLTNPYWAAYQFSRIDLTDRFMGNISLKYDITDWLFVQARIGTDYQHRVDDTYEPYGTAYKPRGDYNQTQRTIREDNADLFIGIDKTFGDFSVDALLGGNRMRNTSENLRAGGNDLVVPYFHSLRNVAAPTVDYGFSEWGINSYFASANLGYKDFLFLNLTGRQDQFSTLAPENSKLFYPSAGLSFVLSDVVTLPQVFTFTKVRASWAQTGGGAPNPYGLNLTYGLVGSGHLGASLGQINNGSIPNAGLKPFLSTEMEIGADFRFLNNRLGVDVAYYDRKTTDDILATNISSTSGFGSTTINIGELRNRGIELLLTGSPIVTSSFKWDISLNYANNQSEVISLGTNAAGEPIQSINLEQSRIQRDQIRHIVGYPLGMIAGYKQLEIDGQKVYDADGFPVTTPGFETLAEGRHPVSVGLNNSFNYKGVSLSFLIDMRYGGHVMSGTNYMAYNTGLHKETVAAREAGGIEVSGVTVNGEANTWFIPADPSNPEDYLVDNYFGRYAMVTENVVYDASYIKLREFSLGYTLPSSLLGNTPLESVSVSLVARNLALLWSKVPNIDPESSYGASGNLQGLEYFAMPVTRNLGFNVSINF